MCGNNIKELSIKILFLNEGHKGKTGPFQQWVSVGGGRDKKTVKDSKYGDVFCIHAWTQNNETCWYSSKRGAIKENDGRDESNEDTW